MNTRGSVHGSIIMERPATYAIISQERYVAVPWLAEANSLVREKTIPTKIKDIKLKDTMTTDFFAAT